MRCGRRRKLCKVLVLAVLCCAVVHRYLALTLLRESVQYEEKSSLQFHFRTPLYSVSPLRNLGPSRRVEVNSSKLKSSTKGGALKPGVKLRGGRDAEAQDVTPAMEVKQGTMKSVGNVSRVSDEKSKKSVENLAMQKKWMEEAKKFGRKLSPEMVMFADLKAVQVDNNKPRVYYNLSAKAKKEGRIGPFVETKRTLKSYNESFLHGANKVSHLLDEMISMSQYDSLPSVASMLSWRASRALLHRPHARPAKMLSLYPKLKSFPSVESGGMKMGNAFVLSGVTETRHRVSSGASPVTRLKTDLKSSSDSLLKSPSNLPSKSLSNSSLKLASSFQKSPSNLTLKSPIFSNLKSPINSTQKLLGNAPPKSHSKRPPKPRPKTTHKKQLSHNRDAAELSLTEAQILELKQKISKINDEQKIANEEIFGPVDKNCTIVVVQVHRRVATLQALVNSLTEAQQVSQVLVVFSHDFWSEDLNQVVRNITAFRTMQVFFPFSVQLHPHVFPGYDPSDCAWNHRRSPAQMWMKKLKVCQNEQWPDSYGHYREARYTQIKHHWWWNKLRVFEELSVTREWGGVALFLEDDHHVAPDILHVLNLLIDMERTMAPKTPGKSAASGRFFSLGTSAKFNARTDRNTVYLETLGSPKLNLGIALDGAGWRALGRRAQFFCAYDDYNWDWTLAALMGHDPQLGGRALAVRPSRVYHMSSCGTHVTPANCGRTSPAAKAVQSLQAVRTLLFPKSLKFGGAVKSRKRKSGNGGWADLRDIELCRAVANGTASEATLERIQRLGRVRA